MHDVRELIDETAGAVERLARRGYELDRPRIRDLVRRRGEITEHRDKLRADANRLARDAATRGHSSKAEIRDLERRLGAVEDELRELLLAIPNLPADDVPSGQEAVVVRTWGEPAEFDFPVKDHVDLGGAMDILDGKRAGKLSGARFSVAKGAGARLERALASFLLDLHTGRHGYVEYSVPAVVTRETMTGTGQLPKFEDDLLRTEVGGRELFLVPTAEVPLTNLYAGETLDSGVLPLALTAHTECFRGEAGSYGRDTRGILRLHQFGKVELVRVCAAEAASRELELLVSHAEACLRALGLVYRVVLLAAGDLGFSARKTYDLEVWLPSSSRYREVSSCSDCGTFQARRARIRVRGRGKSFVATLNGSGLPIGRTMAAIMEQNQDADGGVRIPEVLVPYTGFSRITARGGTE